MIKIKEPIPLAVAEEIIKATDVPMLGCEHAWVAAGAYCGLTGVCGVAVAIGSAFSVILGAACPKDKETSTTMRVVERVVEAIADQASPCCCKNCVRTALTFGCELAKTHLGVELVPATKKM